MALSEAYIIAECDECGRESMIEVTDDPDETLEEQAILELIAFGWLCNNFGTWGEDCKGKAEL